MSKAVQAEQIVSLYRKYCKYSIPVKGFVGSHSVNGFVKVNVIHDQRDLERSTMVRSAKSYVLNSKTLEVLFPGQPVDITPELLRSESGSEKQIGVLRKITNEDAEERQFLEVWKNSTKIVNLDLKALDIHGKVYEDNQFGCLQWSPNEKQIVYVAEKKVPKSESFFAIKGDNERSGNNKDIIPGNEYLYKEDWGEGLVGKCCPVPCIIDVESSTITAIDCLPDDVSFGQAEWTPDGSGVVCVGWYHQTRKLGIKFCSNRESAIFHLMIDKKQYEVIGNGTDKSVHSPRFSPDGSKLVYLESESGGPHHKGSRLVVCDWAQKKTKIVIDLVRHAKDDNFPGIYCKLLPPRVWSVDSNRVIFSSMWRSKEELICVNVENGQIHRLTSDLKDYSWHLIDIQNDILLAAISNPNTKPVPVVATLPTNCATEQVRWVPLEEQEVINNISWSILKCTPMPDTVHEKYPNLDYEAIFVQPTESPTDGAPLIVWPHGGPHAAFSAAYNLYAALFAQLGFASLLINYRGSEGFGEDNLYSLLGNIGKHDVKDCHHALDSVEMKINRKKIVAFGGSHGGFLVAHLIGQYPDFYKACVCRNPVINVSVKVDSTDIPDWNFVESGFDYKLTSLATPEQSKTMWEKSPIQYVDLIKTPVLVLMGKLDLRVPPSQPLLLYNALKTRKIPAKLLCYDDNHSLSKVCVEADVFVNTALWFMEHTN